MNSDNDKTKDNPNNSGSGEHTEDSKNSDQTDGDRVIEHILEQPADSVSDTTSAKAQEKNDTSQNMPVVAAKNPLPTELPIIGLPYRPLFPHMIIPLIVEGKLFREAVKASLKSTPSFIGAFMMKGSADEHPDNIQSEDLYQTGVIGRIVKVLQQEDNSIGILVDVVSRVEMTEFIRTKSFCTAKVTVVQETKQKADNLTKAFAREIISSLKELIQLNPLIREELGQFVNQISIDDPSRLADFSATLTTAEREKLQEILETANISKRLEKTLLLIKKEVDLSRLQAKISKQVEERLSKNQREFFLREQLKEIKKELGLSKDEKTQEIEKLIKRASRLKMPKEAKEVFDEEINKINLLDAQSPEFNVSRNYLDWLVSLPWGVYAKENLDLSRAHKILDRDHYGLEEIKERILEFIATFKLKGKTGGTIICLVGPPGVGKTSIGKSVAAALNRPFYRFSLGGMRDEAEIKGHRRTYIGAMPGKFIQAMKSVKKANPVIMLDEIDKIGNSFHGDPASALLEVLDPEQNMSFSDHYLDVPFDLSKVMFIATANQLDTIPSALLDRMEVLRIAGYITKEKVKIAGKYLVPKQRKANGLSVDMVKFTDDALEKIIDGYARESGVRNLEKNIQKICRKIAYETVKSGKKNLKINISPAEIEKYLKLPLYEKDELIGEGKPGCVNGLAWTNMGGSVLLVESVPMKSESKGFKQSGQLGKVMVESSEIAYSYSVANAKRFGGKENFFKENYIHLHVPAGAVPKDGPSAGITMAVSLMSVVLNRPVAPRLGMTGELTLNGNVLPIGGLKEKVIAARRAGIQQIICPKDNRKDYEELPDYLKEELTFHFVESFDEVMKISLPAKKK